MLKQLVSKYLKNNAQFEFVKKIVKSDKIDHVAIRFKSPSNPFIKEVTSGYQIQPEVYQFYNFKASARWYKSLDKYADIPRLFISTYNGEFRPTIKTPDMYKYVNEENPYLAFVTLFDGDVNHIALEVDNIYTATEECIKNGLQMNMDGGDVYKISRDNQLFQTATLSVPIKHTFSNGKLIEIPYTFVELVHRLNGRDGFEQQNVERIFLSTSKFRN